MRKIDRLVTMLMVAFGGVAGLYGVANATALPAGLYDPKACGTGSCFTITNSTSGGIGISGTATGNGRAIIGTTSTGVGVTGSTGSSGIGVQGSSVGSATAVMGVAGQSGDGVYGVSATGNGVHGYTGSSGSGNAIFGDAGNSVTAWAGNFNGDVNAAGSYYTNGSFVASDARLKKDIKDSSYGLEQLLKLHPVTYKWKQDKDQGTKIGLIAQELQKVVPEVVGTNRSTGMFAVEYTALIPVAIKAVQEQQAVIRQQEASIRQQEARIVALEQALAKKPLAWSLSSGGLGAAGFALGLLPVGLVFARRRRRTAKV